MLYEAYIVHTINLTGKAYIMQVDYETSVLQVLQYSKT